MSYQVNETFNTVQGEGLNAGRPATFIRLQGCTVGCPWCDTKYTWKTGGTRVEAREFVDSLDLLPLVVITGGEPTLHNLDDLIIALRIAGQALWGYSFKIQLETSGQNELKGTMTPDWITWSPKRNLDFLAPASIMRIVKEVKWVVDDELTIADVANGMRRVGETQRNPIPCVLMPEGTPPTQEHVDKALAWLKVHPDWSLGDRLQWRIGVR